MMSRSRCKVGWDRVGAWDGWVERNMRVDSRGMEVLRVLPRLNEEVRRG